MSHVNSELQISDVTQAIANMNNMNIYDNIKDLKDVDSFKDARVFHNDYDDIMLSNFGFNMRMYVQHHGDSRNLRDNLLHRRRARGYRAFVITRRFR